MNNEGYIITTDKSGQPMPTQYNLATGEWVDYHPGEKKPYNCGKCHTTGYSEDGHQDGREGIVGTWALPGIQWERCHGPAADHIAAGGDPSLVEVNTSAELCGQCHIRREATEIPAKGGFIRHHEQFNELLASPHADFDCVTCHDPHKKAEFSIKLNCSPCHSSVVAAFEGSTMQKVGMKCTDCHMPAASKSAVKFGPYQGDVATHLFRINTDPTASMFTDDGAFAKDFVTLDFACLSCHKDKDINWAAERASGIHSLGK